MIKNFLIQPRILISIFVVIVVVVFTSAWIELNQSKKEMLELLEEEGDSLLETILTSSRNALLSYNRIEEEVKKRLLNNANTIKIMEERGMISNSFLEKYAEENNIYRINIFNSEGKKIYSSHKDIHHKYLSSDSVKKYLAPIFEGKKDTLIIGIKQARFLGGQRYAIALSTKDRKAIVLNINADELFKFRNEIGFGVLLKNVTQNSQIIFTVLQNKEGILAASGKIDELDEAENPLLQNSNNLYRWEIKKYKTFEAFEVIHPFIFQQDTIGIFRLGLSLDPLNNINKRIIRRVIIITSLLFVFGFVTTTLIFVNQNFNVLSKRFKVVESYSKKIVDNVSDGIIVLDSNYKIILINKAAQSILNLVDELIGMEAKKVFSDENCEEIFKTENKIFEKECLINGTSKILLFSISKFEDDNKNSNLIIVFRDLTEQKLREKQMFINEKMLAMGKLASTVAHEIRNPLNSIGTIAQQIGKDFEVKENQEEFNNLIKIVYNEVKRINEIIEAFLKFAKPQPINPEEFLLNDFFDELFNQYYWQLKQKNISLIIDLKYHGKVVLDKSQMKQVFINLIENSLDAIEKEGIISIHAYEEKGELNIIFKDNGKGIEQDKLKKIFDFYFTTKKKGSGIGLSIVHKIITEHNGNIHVQSKINEGTSFYIKLPIEYKLGVL
ncbi:MAG: ATP-binding protein [Melioribacteraceae bacterium]